MVYTVRRHVLVTQKVYRTRQGILLFYVEIIDWQSWYFGSPILEIVI